MTKLTASHSDRKSSPACFYCQSIVAAILVIPGSNQNTYHLKVLKLWGCSFQIQMNQPTNIHGLYKAIYLQINNSQVWLVVALYIKLIQQHLQSFNTYSEIKEKSLTYEYSDLPKPSLDHTVISGITLKQWMVFTCFIKCEILKHDRTLIHEEIVNQLMGRYWDRQ